MISSELSIESSSIIDLLWSVKRGKASVALLSLVGDREEWVYGFGVNNDAVFLIFS